MSTVSKIEKDFPYGILRRELLTGVVSSISAGSVRFNLGDAGAPGGTQFLGGRYGKGEVGEFVLIEGQTVVLLGRVTEVRLPEADRRNVDAAHSRSEGLDAVGVIQLLGSVAMDSLRVSSGIEAYPRIGDRIYVAPHNFVARIPRLLDPEGTADSEVCLCLGFLDNASESSVTVRPEKLFGRHCAILGTTGGGKSWTTARIIEECLKHRSKIILLDATGEYRGFSGEHISHFHLGSPANLADQSQSRSLPPTSFEESDFIALFEPAGKVQGPKLRAAMRSLRLAALVPALAPNGFIRKIDQSKVPFLTAEQQPGIAEKLDDPRQGFNVRHLIAQIEQECVWADGLMPYPAPKHTKDPNRWGGESGEVSNCSSLFSRISGILTSSALKCIFQSTEPTLTGAVEDFITNDKRLLRICLSGISSEYQGKEIVANVIGRHLLALARKGAFRNSPIVVFVDEAHNFLGKQIGGEDAVAHLDSFETIAKEGRKFGLNICLSTQRPRDITEGVLSQMGTLVVHRLTNDRDREMVERACGEIDRSASSFLPNLRPGEAAIIGVDFPIPLTMQIYEPTAKPKSDGPNYQEHWKIREVYNIDDF